VDSIDVGGAAKMSVCQICAHEKSREINHMLLRGAMVTVTAKRFAVPLQPLARHRRLHLRFRLRSSGKSNLPETFESKLASLSADLQRLQLEAECSKGVANIDAALRVLKARQNLLEFEAKLAGKLIDGPGTSVTVNTGNPQPQQPTPSPEEMAQMARDYLQSYENERQLFPGEIIDAKPVE
jgi:hypothetical protein